MQFQDKGQVLKVSDISFSAPTEYSEEKNKDKFYEILEQKMNNIWYQTMT